MASDLEQALEDLGRFIRAAGPYVEDLVLIGGWVPFLCRFASGLPSPDHEPILTKDFDFASPAILEERGKRSLDARLRKAGFVVHESRDPLVLRYQDRRFGANELAPIHFEFLTALTGPSRARHGEERQTIEIQQGLPAQALRYLDLLRHRPLLVLASRIPGLEGAAGVTLRVPNPAAYTFQKALIIDKRRMKVPKDLAYVYEVALLWAGREAEVLAMARALSAEAATWAKWLGKARRTLDDLFRTEFSDGPVAIEREMRVASRTRRVSAESALRVVRPFLESALGLAPRAAS